MILSIWLANFDFDNCSASEVADLLLMAKRQVKDLRSDVAEIDPLKYPAGRLACEVAVIVMS